MQETRILSRINRQKLLSPASASPKHTKFRADVFTILSAFCLVFFVFARYNHTLQRTLGGAAAPIPEKEVCSMRNWFSRHPVSFMAFYLLFYLSAFHWLEVHIAVPDVLVHCHLDDLIPFCKYAICPTLRGSYGSRSPCSTCCGKRPGPTSGGSACPCLRA